MFSTIVAASAPPRHRFLERIEIDCRQIDLRNLVACMAKRMLFVVPDREQTAMHAGMQGLDPSIHDFGKTGQFRHITDRKSFLFQSQRGSRPWKPVPRLHRARDRAQTPQVRLLSETDSRARRTAPDPVQDGVLETTAMEIPRQHRVSPAGSLTGRPGGYNKRLRLECGNPAFPARPAGYARGNAVRISFQSIWERFANLEGRG
jgi:hypothetical protein